VTSTEWRASPFIAQTGRMHASGVLTRCHTREVPNLIPSQPASGARSGSRCPHASVTSGAAWRAQFCGRHDIYSRGMQTCRLRDGRTLEYCEFGEADGKAVVYLAGTPDL